MTENSTYVSRYDRRVRLVANALMDHSDLDDRTAVTLAEHALDAIDYLPEEVR
jgi:Family of unknown function (DUF6307)